jgi:hypothetical protein
LHNRQFAWQAPKARLGRLPADTAAGSFLGMPVPGKNTWANMLLNLTEQIVPAGYASKMKTPLFSDPARANRIPEAYRHLTARAPATNMSQGLLSMLPGGAPYADALHGLAYDPAVAGGLSPKMLAMMEGA